ncbi:MAG TPA: HAD-IB family hydrolase [Acidimicrobiaceae bacterium]|nr:HAD-IB family hydrolase [Acidimicrobiaceae bacterium]
MDEHAQEHPHPEHSAPPPVYSAGPSAAFFDLDRTLISGSSAFVLGIAAWRAKLVSTPQMVRDATSAITFRLVGADDDTSHGVRDRILGAVKGIHLDDLVALNADIVPKLLERVRPESRRLVEQHRHAGRATYIVSASPVELVEPLAKALGMTAGIGTRSRIVDGVYTGELDGPFCYGPGKVEAIEELARWEGLDLDQCWAYSDSASDLPMMEAVGHPVAVNPDPKLERVAGTRGWPVVVFSKRTKAVIRRTSQAVGAVGLATGGFLAGTRYTALRKR